MNKPDILLCNLWQNYCISLRIDGCGRVAVHVRLLIFLEERGWEKGMIRLAYHRNESNRLSKDHGCPPQMNKGHGRYDDILIFLYGTSPAGPFTYMENSPVSYKPTGFIGGAGHGCIFTAGSENYWKAATNSISVRHMFERRVSFYPSGFDKDGYLFTNTYLGDYPMFLPGGKEQIAGEYQPGWMLLSYGKKVSVSSSLEGYPAENIVDEDARTAWVAQSNRDMEWAQVDLQRLSSIHAIQVNFDEYGANQKGAVSGVYQSYLIYASVNGEDWSLVVDYGTKKTDTPHDYIEFEEPFKARYIKLQNKEYTVSENFSVRDLRIFGKGQGSTPRAVNDFTVERDEADPCKARLCWEAVPDAQGYIVRYGIAGDKLYNNFQVMGENTLEIGSLNKGVAYYFTIDAYNENGITRTSRIKVCR